MNSDPTGSPPREYRQLRYEPPPGATRIVLVRHGESAPVDPGVPFPLVDGRGDPELSPLGREQAERVAVRLGGTDVDAIYVTTLRRTAETAAPLAHALSLEPTVEADLAEVRLGEWEGGLYRMKVTDRDPLAVEMTARERWDVVPGAETNEEVAARVTAAIERIASSNRDRSVVVFAHGGTIGTVLAVATRSRPFAFVGSDNGAISEIVVDPAWRLRGFNDRSHLTGIATSVTPRA